MINKVVISIRYSSVICVLLMLGGCGIFPEQTEKKLPKVEVPADWEAEHEIASEELSSQLLNLINQPQLEQLVQQTLVANYDLRRTALRLKEQRLLIRQARAARIPELSLNLNSQRDKNEVITNQHALSLDVSWEVDVWGRLADAARAAKSDAKASAYDYQAAANSLAARVIQRWVDISLRDQIILAEIDWFKSLENTETVIAERYRSGLGELADLEAARAETARIQASLSARKQAQVDAYRQLALLQGKTARIELPKPQRIPDITNPPVFLPADVIANRPDLLSAYHHVIAADARTDVAYKELIPSFNLTASLGQSRPHISDLLSGSSAWTLLGKLTAPLFNAGRLRASAEIAGLEAERSYLAYQQTLLNAFNEVEAALGQEATLAEQEKFLRMALMHYEVSLNHYQARYRDGINDILDLLTAKQAAFEARIQLLETRQERLSNRINLGLALGMGV